MGFFGNKIAAAGKSNVLVRVSLKILKRKWPRQVGKGHIGGVTACDDIQYLSRCSELWFLLPWPSWYLPTDSLIPDTSPGLHMAQISFNRFSGCNWVKEIVDKWKETGFFHIVSFSSFFGHIFPLHINFETMIFKHALDFPVTTRKKEMELYPKYSLQLSKECWSLLDCGKISQGKWQKSSYLAHLTTSPDKTLVNVLCFGTE